jgi:RNA polymerase sigma factor (sigma-70 family)
MSASRPLDPASFRLLCDVIAYVVRCSRLRPDDADEFTQTVHLKLLERNYAPLDAYSGRSSLRTFLVVIVRRQLLDWRNAQYGRWRPTARARREGQPAVDLERLVARDGLSRDEAVAVLTGRDRSLNASMLRELAACISPRRRARHVALDDIESTGRCEFEDPVAREEAAAVERRLRAALCRAYGRLPAEDRRFLQLRFGRGISITAIAALQGMPVKLLFRRMDRIKLTLRRAIVRSGVTSQAEQHRVPVARPPAVQ